MPGNERGKGDLSIDLDFFDLLAGSYRRFVGTPLVPAGRGAAWLYRTARCVVLAHDRGADPRFIYANRAAQACFGYRWEEFVGMPSRLSAEAPERAERERLFDRLKREGCIADFRGVRVAKSGRRFRVEHGVVWQLVDAAGNHHGDAAMFFAWSDLGT